MAKPKSKSKKPVPKKPVPKKPAKKAAAKQPPAPKALKSPSLRSIRSVIFQVDDLAKAKLFYAAALGCEPYFDEPFYVGYNIEGQELGLHPDVSTLKPGPGGAVAYWRVDDIHASWTHILSIGATAIEPPRDVGGGILTAIVADPFGNLVGLIEQP